MSSPTETPVPGSQPGGGPADPAELYLDLLKKSLTRVAFPERYHPIFPDPDNDWLRPVHAVLHWLQGRDVYIMRRRHPDLQGRPLEDLRDMGGDWPAEGETMIGLQRLDNVQSCVTDVVRSGVPGDLIETGVWRGGSTIFMRGVLKALGDESRTVWVADSFQGLPKPNAEHYQADSGSRLWTYTELAVSAAEVRANFERYGLLDEQVRFLEGWFSDTLPTAPIERLAVLRLDGDMYQSTIEVLETLYPKLSVGGYLIVDDYGALPECRQAVHEYRDAHAITDEIVTVDWTGAYWQRT